MSEIPGVYVIDYSKQYDDAKVRIQAFHNCRDDEAIKTASEKVITQIDLAIRLGSAEKERRMSHAIIALLLQRLGGNVFVRQSERDDVAAKGLTPGYLPEFELSEAEETPINGVIMRLKER